MKKLFITFELEPVAGQRTAQEEQVLAKSIFVPIFSRLVDAGLVVLDEADADEDADERDEFDEDDEGVGPFKWDEYGWYCDCEINRTTITVMLQRSDQWMIQVWADRGLFDRLRGRHHIDELRTVANKVVDCVRSEFGVEPLGPMTEAELRLKS